MTEYAYKMEGLDQEWNYLKTNRKVYFTNLAPGNYYFKVRVVDSPGKFEGNETILAIEILPPFWKGIPAYILYLILLTFLVYLLFKNYNKKIIERNRKRIDFMRHEREKSLYKSKIDFFTLIAHEIRTPLTLIKAPLEKALLNTSTNLTAQKHLKLIEKNTDRLITLSGQLLDFRKVEAHGFSLNFKNENVSELLWEIYRNFEVSVKDRKQFLIETGEAPIFVETDKEAFIKIVTNLTDNALKYSDTFARIQLTNIIIDGCPKIELSISNDGQCIPEHLRETVFKPFSRIKNDTIKQGTGLGLALSRSLAELLNGSLELKTDDANLNIFILILPLKQAKYG
jgi:signal transduction histidine kinase